MYSVLLGTFLAVAAAQQHIKDPVKDFCRRHKQQTCVIDGKLYIDGGRAYYGGGINNDSVAEQNTWLLWEDTSDVKNEFAFPIQYANLTKEASVPSVSGGVLWPDEANKLFYLFGGEYPSVDDLRTRDTKGFTLWFYDIIYNTWNRSVSDASQSSVKWPALGAGTVSDIGIAYYYGGYLTESSDSTWRGDRFMLNNLISFDMNSRRWGNNTWDQTPRAEGSLHYIPASDGGMLVYFGGVETNSTGGVNHANMSQIHLFDIANSRWYTQTATGDVPEPRRSFCSGVVWAKDQSSYNIYLFGGFGANDAGLGDLYVLSLPSFRWILVWPTPKWATFPGGRGWSSCDVYRNSQLMIIGGYYTNSSVQDCDVPTIGGQHAVLLGQENVELGSWWHAPLDNITEYRVPDQIVEKIGGDADGSATATAPARGWDQDASDLSVYLRTTFAAQERTATRLIPVSTGATEPTSSSGGGSNAGAIAGGVVGGVVGLAAAVALVFFCLRHRRRKQEAQGHGKFDPNLPSNPSTPGMAQTMTSGISPVSQGSTQSPLSHPSPYSPQSSPPPPSTPWHGVSSAHYGGPSPPPYTQPGTWSQQGNFSHPQAYYPPPSEPSQSPKEYSARGLAVELPGANTPANVELPSSSSPVNAKMPQLRSPKAVRGPGFI